MESESALRIATFVVDNIVNALDAICVVIQDHGLQIVDALKEIDKSVGYIDLTHD